MTCEANAAVRFALLATCAAALTACKPAPPPAPAAAPRIVAQALDLPVRAASRSDVSTAPDGSLLLSWVEPVGDTLELRYARRTRQGWGKPVPVVQADWFGNAMDMPHVRQTPDGAMWAVWPSRSQGVGHARDIVLSRSTDGGAHWAAPLPVNDDHTPTEHGFVSTWNAGEDRLGLVWLDGRAKANVADASTMLRMATFGSGLSRADDAPLDGRACDCCQTDAAMLDGQVLVAYRDRDEAEHRDIRLLRSSGGGWLPASTPTDEGWEIAGCPMNGPAVAGGKDAIVLAWFTMAGGTPRVKTSFAVDGMSFGPAELIDAGPQVEGQVDTAIHDGASWVSWLRRTSVGLELWVARRSAEGGPTTRQRVARLAIQGRAPAPRLAATAGGLIVVWEDIGAGTTVLRALRLSVPGQQPEKTHAHGR
jgi:hypothetical protein